MPFDQLPDPASADILEADVLLDDPEIAADLAEARAAGPLETDPDEAWGNAAIQGFGIGRPAPPPELDPAATPLPVAAPAETAPAQRTFAIAPDALVLAAAPDAPLYISLGGPAAAGRATAGSSSSGSLGAVLAIVLGDGPRDAWLRRGVGRVTPAGTRRALRGRRPRSQSWPSSSSPPTTTSSAFDFGSTRRGPTSTWPSSSATTCCRTSSRPSVT